MALGVGDLFELDSCWPAQSVLPRQNVVVAGHHGDRLELLLTTVTTSVSSWGFSLRVRLSASLTASRALEICLAAKESCHLLDGLGYTSVSESGDTENISKSHVRCSSLIAADTQGLLAVMRVPAGSVVLSAVGASGSI